MSLVRLPKGIAKAGDRMDISLGSLGSDYNISVHTPTAEAVPGYPLDLQYVIRLINIYNSIVSGIATQTKDLREMSAKAITLMAEYGLSPEVYTELSERLAYTPASEASKPSDASIKATMSRQLASLQAEVERLNTERELFYSELKRLRDTYEQPQSIDPDEEG